MGSQKNKKTNELDREPTIHERLMQPIFAGPLEKAGITAEYLAEKLKEELEAEETKFFSYQGVVVEKKNIVAWGVRQRARESANELRGDFPAKRTEIGGIDGKDITVIVKHYSEDKPSGDRSSS